MCSDWNPDHCIPPISPGITSTDGRFDARDRATMAAAVAQRERIPGPRLGDFIRWNDGGLTRICHDLGDRVQHYRDGGYHMFRDGSTSYSGSLFVSVPKSGLIATDERLPGAFWTFHHQHVEAHNGVWFFASCRVYAMDLPTPTH